jgi:hypothetical protein
VDTNALVFLIENSPPRPSLLWVRCHTRGSALSEWVLSRFENELPGISVRVRDLSEALATGLSRHPSELTNDGPVLGSFAAVLRGIATGANEFFFLTRKRAAELGLPSEFLIPAIGRTRDVLGDVIDVARLEELDAAGRPTLLFAPDSRKIESFPRPVRDYLKEGERLGLPSRTLISTRRPWYKMERRVPPPFLFAYLGRRNARFVRNSAGVVPLTGFLCVYPRSREPAALDALWYVVRHPDTVANLALVGKSYGSGAIKVEPRALESLPLPSHVLSVSGLRPVADEQLVAL